VDFDASTLVIAGTVLIGPPASAAACDAVGEMAEA